MVIAIAVATPLKATTDNEPYFKTAINRTYIGAFTAMLLFSYRICSRDCWLVNKTILKPCKDFNNNSTHNNGYNVKSTIAIAVLKPLKC